MNALKALPDNKPGSEAAKKIARFDPKRDQIDYNFIRKVQPLFLPLAKYFRAEIHGVQHLPKDKGCLCVSNHSAWGIDSIILYTLLYQATGRVFRGLGQHLLFSNPFTRHFFLKVGAVDGNRENAVKMLKAGEWGLCYPGGAREAFKTFRERYQLKWEGRMGYLRSAIAANVPIVPLAGIGADEAYISIGKEPLIGRRLFGHRDYDMPILLGLGPLPLPVKFKYVFGKPIDIRKEFGLSARDANASDDVLQDAHEAVWTRTQKLIQENLDRRTRDVLRKIRRKLNRLAA